MNESIVLPPGVSVDDRLLARLTPIHALAAEGRRKLLTQAVHYRLARGERLHARDTAGVFLYLLSGNLTLSIPGQPPRAFPSDAASLTQPVFPPAPPPGALVRAQGQSHLMGLDCSLFELLVENNRESPLADSRDLDGSESVVFDRLLKDYHQGCLEIPRVAETAERVLTIASKESIAERTLLYLVECDPVLALTAVKQAGGSVKGVRAAMAVLGPEATRQMILERGLTGVCRTRSSLVRHRLIQALRHSIEVATYSYVLAKSLRGFDPDKAYFCGLMHDIGTFPALCRADAHLGEIGGPQELDNLVSRMHDVIGGLVLSGLGLDRDVIITAEECDDWRRDSGPKPDYADIVLVAQLHTFMVGNGTRALPRPEEVPAFRKIAGDHMGPKLSLWLIGKARQRLEVLDRVLAGPRERLAGGR